MLGGPVELEMQKVINEARPKRYDIVTDEKIPVTQEVWDRAELLCSIQQLQRQIVNFAINASVPANRSTVDLGAEREKLLQVTIYINNLSAIPKVSPPSDQRRAGNSRLVYDKDRRTIITDYGSPPGLIITERGDGDWTT